MNSDDGAFDDVVRREMLLLEPAVRASPTRVTALLHPDFVEFGVSGRRWDRAGVVAALAAVVDGGPVEVRALSAMRLAEDVVWLTYEAHGAARVSLRSSLWLRVASGWLLRFHQGTPTAGRATTGASVPDRRRWAEAANARALRHGCRRRFVDDGGDGDVARCPPNRVGHAGERLLELPAPVALGDYRLSVGPVFPDPTSRGRTVRGIASAVWSALLLAAVVLVVAPSAVAGSAASTLAVNERLLAGQSLGNAQYQLLMRSDGNLVELGNGRALWSTGTSGTGTGNRLVMQGDGNLVLYGPGGQALWASGTAGTGSANRLALQADGNLVVYAGSGPVWANGAPGSDALSVGGQLRAGQYLHGPTGYRLVMQADGNLVLYGRYRAVWASNTYRSGGNRVVLQRDGNLVIYSVSRAVWASNTAGTAATRAVVQADANVVVYSPTGAVWATNTSVHAKTGGYPDAAALCSNTGRRDGYCRNYAWGYRQSNGTWRVFSDRGFAYRNCTDYVAWRLGLTWTDVSAGGDGSARAWKSGWINRSRSWGTSPQTGAVAWWGTETGGGYGHVAVVVAVNQDGTARVAEYNADDLGNFDDTRSVRADAYLYR